MDYEQKYAKALWQMKELYNRVRYLSSPEALLTTVTLENTFPELKESEDDRIRKFLIDYINSRCWYDKFPYTQEQVISWLEKQGEHANFRNKIQIGDKVTRNEAGDLVNLSQLNRVAKEDEKQGAQKPSWSEEDEDALDIAIRIIQNGGDDCAGILDSDKALKWLKSLKDRVQPQPKQEWDVQDEAFLGDAIYAAKNIYSEKCGQEELIDWLKSLKPNHWKPSEEEMEALLYALGKGGTYNREALNRLYNNLKKL